MSTTAPAVVQAGTTVEMKFAWIPPGRFLMGSDKADNEKPVHRVTISKGFWMGIYPVTQAQFAAVMGYNPSHFSDQPDSPSRPVEKVNWTDAQEFCTAFGTLTSRAIRLPSEAEWEYACRAGSNKEYWNGDGEAALKKVGWYGSTSGPSKGQTQPVGKLDKNPWGLHDVHGNVWEWCQDEYGPYSGEDQVDTIKRPNRQACVVRGGSWAFSPVNCRSTCRYRLAPAGRDNYVGFRVCFRLDK